MRAPLPLLLPSPGHASQAPRGDSGLLWKAFLKHKHTIINAQLLKGEFLAQGGKKGKKKRKKKCQACIDFPFKVASRSAEIESLAKKGGLGRGWENCHTVYK